MTKSRGVRGAAGGCAVASLVYLLARGLLTLLVSALMGLAHPGASLAKPLGFSGVSTALFQLLIGLGAIVLTLVFLLKVTRLKTKDLRIMLPAPWSPGFCLPVFLGVANLANLVGALINRLTGSPATSEMLPSGGPELLVQFLALCVMPAIAEELLFRGAFQGLMRPCGSAAAIFAPALLFGVLHLDLAQGLTAFACGVFLGWLAERSGSILPGMLLHLVNNALAFLTIYLRYYPGGGLLRCGAVHFAVLPGVRRMDDLQCPPSGVQLFGGTAPRRGCADRFYQPGLLRNGAVSCGLRRNFCTLRG